MDVWLAPLVVTGSTGVLRHGARLPVDARRPPAYWPVGEVCSSRVWCSSSGSDAAPG